MTQAIWELKKIAIARVYNIHPDFYDYFHLRNLLQHVRVSTFFKSLHTIVRPTFQASCRKLGLLESGDH